MRSRAAKLDAIFTGRLLSEDVICHKSLPLHEWKLFITIAQGCQEITVKESIWRLHPGIQIARLKHCSGVTFIVRLCLMLSCAISPSLGMELHETDFPVQINTELKI